MNHLLSFFLVAIFRWGSSWLLSVVVAAASLLKSDPVWQLLVVGVVSLRQVLPLETYFPSLFFPSEILLHHFHSAFVWSTSLTAHPRLQIFFWSLQTAPRPLLAFSCILSASIFFRAPSESLDSSANFSRSVISSVKVSSSVASSTAMPLANSSSFFFQVLLLKPFHPFYKDSLKVFHRKIYPHIHHTLLKMTSRSYESTKVPQTVMPVSPKNGDTTEWLRALLRQ